MRNRIPAFALLEISIVLIVIGFLIVTILPLFVKMQRKIETQKCVEIALQSLGGFVAMHGYLPKPDNITIDDEYILQGQLPVHQLGLSPSKKFKMKYAVEKKLTDERKRLNVSVPSCNFCNPEFENHFPTELPLSKDIIAFKLTKEPLTVSITRNNFVAQYCGTVCKAS